MIREMAQTIETSPELEFSTFGAMLIKPDAIDLGVGEEIIAHVTQVLESEGIGTLEGVFIINNIDRNNIPLLYPDLPADGQSIVVDYLTEGSCIQVTFRGVPGLALRIKEIKGKRIMDWSEEELMHGVGISKSIRGMMPVPGSRELYDPIIDKIIERKRNPNVRLSPEEFKIYCRNLIHSPDNLTEVLGLLCILDDEQRSQVLNEKQQEIFNEFAKMLNI